MRKVLAVFDGLKYSDGASKYAIELAKATNSLLVGVFVQDMRYMNVAQAFTWDQPYIDFSSIEEIEREDKEKIDLNIALFNRLCNERGIRHKVHLDRGVPLQEVLRESIFADYIIIDSHTSFFSVGNETPSPFLKDLLVDSHCPVLIVPHHYTYFDNVVLCYDGSASSVHAIKMFSYVFPELNDVEATVVSVNEKPTNHLAQGKNFKDLVQLHYKNINYVVLQGNAEEQLLAFLKQKANNSIVVMGAYGRNALSRLFQQSLANKVIKEVNVPVFVTHQ